MIFTVINRTFILSFIVLMIFCFQNCSSRDFVFQKDLGSINGGFTNPTPTEDQLVLGKSLFGSNCASCHNSPDHYVMGRSSKEDRTADQIFDAINNVPSMSGLSFLKQLSSSQLEAISVYLKTVVTDPTDPSTPPVCKTDFKPERSPIRLLSHIEYDNIAVDVFKSKKKPSVDAKFIIAANGISGFSNTSITSDPTSPPITDLTVEKFLTAANIVADEVIANKAQAGSGYSVLAPCAVGVSTVAESCYDSIIRNVGMKVWRRPVSESSTNNEFARLKAIIKTGSFDNGFRLFIKTLLMSPNFLTVSFTPSTTLAAGTPFNLNDFQLATRLSFFLWASTPDDDLLNAARTNALSNATNLREQVLRMIRDPKSKRFASRLTNEWLGVDNITGLGITSIPNTTLSAMIMETQYMFENIIANDLSFLDSISADYSFLNKALADFYGVPFSGANTASFYRTSMASTPRRGVVNHASFLIATAGAKDETHPVIRGKLVSTRLGCYEIAPPPADLDISLPPSLPANSTPAEVLAIHTQRTQCASCHKTLDPYGLPLETYDSRGIWRTTYPALNNRSIATSGVLPSGESFGNTQEFMSTLATSPNIRSCLVKKVMASGLARRVATLDDQCIAAQISVGHMKPDSKFSELILNIVNSRQFRMQTTEAL